MSYGICSAFGVFFGPMHSVLPFLLLGIGLDDMFVIAQSWDSLEIGQAHDMFSRIFRIRFFFYEILCNICFDFLKFSKLRKEYLCIFGPIRNLFSFSTDKVNKFGRFVFGKFVKTCRELNNREEKKDGQQWGTAVFVRENGRSLVSCGSGHNHH